MVIFRCWNVFYICIIIIINSFIFSVRGGLAMDFNKNYTYPFSIHKASLIHYLTARYGLYSDTDAIWIRRKEVKRLTILKQYFNIDIAYFNDKMKIKEKHILLEKVPNLEEVEKKIKNNKRRLKYCEEGVNVIFNIEVRRFILNEKGQWLNDITFQNGELIIY